MSENPPVETMLIILLYRLYVKAISTYVDRLPGTPAEPSFDLGYWRLDRNDLPAFLIFDAERFVALVAKQRAAEGVRTREGTLGDTIRQGKLNELFDDLLNAFHDVEGFRRLCEQEGESPLAYRVASHVTRYNDARGSKSVWEAAAEPVISVELMGADLVNIVVSTLEEVSQLLGLADRPRLFRKIRFAHDVYGRMLKEWDKVHFKAAIDDWWLDTREEILEQSRRPDKVDADPDQGEGEVGDDTRWYLKFRLEGGDPENPEGEPWQYFSWVKYTGEAGEELARQIVEILKEDFGTQAEFACEPSTELTRAARYVRDERLEKVADVINRYEFSYTSEAMEYNTDAAIEGLPPMDTSDIPNYDDDNPLPVHSLFHRAKRITEKLERDEAAEEGPDELLTSEPEATQEAEPGEEGVAETLEQRRMALKPLDATEDRPQQSAPAGEAAVKCILKVLKDSGEAFVGGVEWKLGPVKFKILTCLAEQPGKVARYWQLAHYAGLPGTRGDDPGDLNLSTLEWYDNLRHHVLAIRRSYKKARKRRKELPKDLIRTLRTKGYRLNLDASKVSVQ